MLPEARAKALSDRLAVLVWSTTIHWVDVTRPAMLACRSATPSSMNARSPDSLPS